MTVVSKSLISGLTLAILAASAVGVHAQDKMAPGGAMKPPGGAMMAPAAVRETLENLAHLRDNGPVMAGQGWVDGRQATRLL